MQAHSSQAVSGERNRRDRYVASRLGQICALPTGRSPQGRGKAASHPIECGGGGDRSAVYAKPARNDRWRQTLFPARRETVCRLRAGKNEIVTESFAEPLDAG